MVVLLILLADLIGQLQPVHLRHQPVGNQHTDRALVNKLKRGRGIVGDSYVAVPCIAEGSAHHHTAEFGVVYHEDGKIKIWHC